MRQSGAHIEGLVYREKRGGGGVRISCTNDAKENDHLSANLQDKIKKNMLIQSTNYCTLFYAEREEEEDIAT